MTRLTIRLLGGFEAVLDGKPLTGFESDKVRALLAYLAMDAGRPLRREILTGLLWPDSPESSARASLRNALANLRRTIGDKQAKPSFLCVTRQTITFDEASNTWLDVNRFNQAYQVSERSSDGDKSHLEQAISLYRGPLLDGFSVASIPFQEWLLVERERLQRLMVEALRQMAVRYLEEGQPERALDYAWRQVELEPWEEEGQRMLVRLLASSGRRGEALAQYAHCCRMLRDTLGVEPSDETVALYRQILAGQVSAVPSKPANNLPLWLTPLIGRQPEIGWVRSRLASHGGRLLTITGPGGIGKTHLALEAAEGVLNRFPDGAFLVSLAALPATQEIMPILAQVLNLPSKDNVDLRQQLFDFLRPKALLLILDSFEYLIAAPGLASQTGTRTICDLLEEVPRLKILVTSRTRLNLHGEHVLILDGLGCPQAQANNQPGSDIDPRAHSAVALFLNSAQRLRPGFSPTADELQDIGRICRQVDGLPLAIILAASWVDLLTPREIATEIDRNLDFLTVESDNVPRRHHSLRAVFDHSWRLLTDKHKAIYQSLSVFRGGFTRIAAQAVAGASAHDLRYLVNRSLLRRSSEGRFTLHPLLRYYAAEKLAAASEMQTTVGGRHSACYLAYSHEWAQLLKGRQQAATIAEMGPEINNLKVAWEWAIANRAISLLSQGLDGLCMYYEFHNLNQRGLAICQATIRRTADERSTEGLRLRARLLSWQSCFSANLGRMEQAIEMSRQSLMILQDSRLVGAETPPEAALAYLQLSRQLTESDLAEARQLAQRSLDLFLDQANEWGTNAALEVLGEVAWLTADYACAYEHFLQCLPFRRAQGERPRLANLLGILGFICFNLGKFEQAEKFTREGIALRQQLGDLQGAADSLFNLAMAMIWLGEFDEVNNLLSQAIVYFHESGVVTEKVKLQALQAMAQALSGQYSEASDLVEAGLSVAQAGGLDRETGILLWVQGFLLVATGNGGQAERHLAESCRILDCLGLIDILAAAQAARGYAALVLDDLARARHQFGEALRHRFDPQSSGVALLALPGIALLMARSGHLVRGLEIDSLAATFPLIANASFFEDIARQPLASLAAQETAEAVVAARARGLELDLLATVRMIPSELNKLPVCSQV